MPPLTTVDPTALDIIAATPAVLRALLGRLPPNVLLHPNDEGWSLKDIVAHLHDVEEGVMVARIRRLLGEDRPFIRSIDPPARLVTGGYTACELPELLGDLERQRRENVAWLRGLSATDLARAGEHDEVGEIHVSDIAHQWAAHDMSHMRQIAMMLQQHLVPMMGATRAFYDV